MSAEAPTQTQIQTQTQTQTQATATKPHETQTQTTNAKQEESQSASQPHTADYAPYPKLDPDDVVPPPPQHQEPPLNTESRAPISGDAATTMPKDSNPYVTPAPVAASSTKSNYLFSSLFFFSFSDFTRILSQNLYYFRSYFRFRQRRSRQMGQESRRGHQKGGGSRRQHVAALYVFISCHFLKAVFSFHCYSVYCCYY